MSLSKWFQREQAVQFLSDEKNRKNVKRILVFSLLLFAVFLSKSILTDPGYIMDRKGNLIGLHRENRDTAQSYDLKVKLRRKDQEEERNITLTINGSGEATGVDVGEAKTEETLEELLNDVLDDLRHSRNKNISLPTSLTDGTSIEWEKGGSMSFLLFLLLPAVLLFALYGDSINRERREVKQEADDILRELPGFCSQLQLMLDCGLIMSDAFGRIAEGYRQAGRNSCFRRIIIDAWERSQGGRESIVTILHDEAAGRNIRAFSRIVSMLTENQYRGIDLRSKLKSEGEFLWEQRKKIAEEKGKLAETKMTLPLAVLLAVLILITAAPAVLQVKGV